jgi:hypothetical protein
MAAPYADWLCMGIGREKAEDLQNECEEIQLVRRLSC